MTVDTGSSLEGLYLGVSLVVVCESVNGMRVMGDLGLWQTP